MKKTLLLIGIVTAVCYSQDLDIGNVIRLIYNALNTDAGTNEETIEKSPQYIDFLKNNISKDSSKIGLALLDAYSVVAMKLNFDQQQNGNSERKQEIDSLKKAYSEEQKALLSALFNSNLGLKSKITLKLLMRPAELDINFQDQVAEYLLTKPHAVFGDTVDALYFQCHKKESLKRICDKYSHYKLTAKSNMAFAGFYSVCTKCLEGYIPDEELLNYLQQNRIIDTLLPNKEDVDFGELDQKISELETRIKLKKEKEAKEKKEKQQTK